MEIVSEVMEDYLAGLISIIVPVYNCEKYLDTCIKSLLRQTYKNIEIILVDDGSADKSPLICDIYAGLDNRVKVLHQINLGVSAARNSGINLSRGEFLTFVDSDDYISETYCEKMFVQIDDSTDLVIGRTIAVNNGRYIDDGYKGGDVDTFNTSVEKNILYRSIFVDNPLINKYPHISTCSAKLFRKKTLIENAILYNTELKIYEDAIFNTQAINASRVVKLIGEKIYFYRFNSLSGSNCFDFSILDQYDKIYDYFKYFGNDISYSYTEYCNYFAIKNLNTILLNFFRFTHNRREFKKLLKEIRKRDVYLMAIKSVNYKPLPKRRKVLVFCLRYRLDHVLYLVYSNCK